MIALFGKKRSRKGGFTLVEAIVSIAVFAIAAVMIAMILFTATSMVRMSLVYDSDREKLAEAAALSSSTYDGVGDNKTLVVELEVRVAGESGTEKFTIDLRNGNTLKEVDGKYYVYTLKSTGRQYYIFVSN